MIFYKKNILIPIAFILLAIGFYAFFTHNKPYEIFLKPFVKNWVNNDGERKKETVPFHKPNNKNTVQWDAKHYQLIKDYGYDIEKAGNDFIFAFFPLFPFVWKFTNLPPIGILFFNFILFSIALLLLDRWLSNKNTKTTNVLLSFALPSVIIFLIPYTEALFFLLITLGIYGILKNKYVWFFMGFFMASLTRPAYTILGLAIICSEIYFLAQHRNIKLFFKRLIMNTLPLVLGTISVAVIHLSYGSSSFFTFVEVQKYWETIFRFPSLHLSDWSHEGFSINLSFLLMIFFPLLIWLSTKFVQKIRQKAVHQHIDNYDFLQILSIIYLLGTVFFILFFKGGSIHCMFRYTMCTPFFYVLLYLFKGQIKKKYLYIIFFILSLLILWGLSIIPYTSHYSFSDFGGLLFLTVFWLWVLQKNNDKKWYKLATIILVGSNILWTSYLFSMYLSNGWIFA